MWNFHSDPKMIKKVLFSLLLMALLAAPSVFAGEIKVQAGASVTSQVVPLVGGTTTLGYRFESKNWPFGFDHKEIDLLYHNLTGSGVVTDGTNSATTGVSIQAYELNYFMTWDLGGTAIGPGIGYGVMSMQESVSSSNGTGDPSPFFTGVDIHYGVLLFKMAMAFDFFGCDLTASSFGGLIGGTAGCGIEF